MKVILNSSDNCPLVKIHFVPLISYTMFENDWPGKQWAWNERACVPDSRNLTPCKQPLVDRPTKRIWHLFISVCPATRNMAQIPIPLLSSHLLHFLFLFLARCPYLAHFTFNPSNTRSCNEQKKRNFATNLKPYDPRLAPRSPQQIADGWVSDFGPSPLFPSGINAPWMSLTGRKSHRKCH